MIGLQTNVLSWSVEFVTGGIVWIDIIFSFSAKQSWEQVFITVTDVFLFAVIQPCTYIIKTREVKDQLSNQGWNNTLRKFLGLKTIQISPPEAIEMNQVREPPNNELEMPQPIETISERVEHDHIRTSR